MASPFSCQSSNPRSRNTAAHMAARSTGSAPPSSAAISRSITQPIYALRERAQSIGRGDIAAREPAVAEDETLQALSSSLEHMAQHLQQQMELNRQEQDKLRAMELALLQSQINPHFLYNTLDTIIWLVETGKNEQAVEMVTSLSNFFRSSLSKGRDIITLGEEEIHVRSYLEIQQVRYRDILCYEIHVQPELRSHGTGGKILEQLLDTQQLFLLEIEPPEDEITCRRKHFYERNGLCAQPYGHVQLPFQGGGSIVPLVIMSNQNLSAQQCRAFQQYLLNRVVRYTQYRKTLDMADIIDI